MSFARDVYTATEEQTDFTITFPYIADSHVVVTQEGTTLTQDTDYTIVSETTVRLTTEATEGDIVIVKRSTSQSTRLVDYATASTLTEEDLDNDSLQAFYLAQEAADIAAAALGVDAALLWDAQSKRITEVAEPTADQDAATKAYVDEVLTEEGNLPASMESEDGDILVVTTEGTAAWAELSEAYIPDGLIDAGMLAPQTITDAEMANESVTAPVIEDGAVNTEHLANEAVTGAILEDGAVNTEHFTAESVTSTVLENAGVTLAKIDATAGAEGEYLRNEEATSVVWAEATPGWTYAAEVDFVDETTADLVTGLPATVSEIEIIITDLSTDANASYPMLRLGHASAYDATGYVNSAMFRSDGSAEAGGNTTGFPLGHGLWTAAETFTGVVRLVRGKDNTQWAYSSNLARDDGLAVQIGQGAVTLEGALTRIQMVVVDTTLNEIVDGGEAVVRYR